ncbi:hypothetical protein EDF32_0444 [Cellulomonas sp. PhB143]|nr:hypothetical protein EDF32_0444 [Cellulomonas sp. PhB143]
MGLAGPPTRNLAKGLGASTWRWNGPGGELLPTFYDRGRTQESHLVPTGEGHRRLVPRRTREIQVEGPLGRATLVVQESGQELFAGHRVLVTLSKNNDLLWVEEWAEYYAREHGTSAVLFYDNGSDAYTPEDILSTLSRVPGIEVVVVVPWNFPYGPGGGPAVRWDSDYCQYSVLEHARRRYLARASGVLSVDIDELVLTADGRAVYAHASEARYGAVVFQGRWIEKASEEAVEGVPSFADYFHYDPTLKATTKKWCIDPRRLPGSVQWRVHSLNPLQLDVDPEILHRHFKGVNTDWKYRRKAAVVDPERLVADLDIRDAVARRRRSA